MGGEVSTDRVVIGVDPGVVTGVAIFRRGRLGQFVTTDHADALVLIRDAHPSLVVLEDSRKDPLYARSGVTARGMARIARSVGEIDQRCREIEDMCKSEGVEILCVSPRGKGRKINAAEFRAVTGWTGRTNQHVRDAVMVAWPYRNGIETRIPR